MGVVVMPEVDPAAWGAVWEVAGGVLVAVVPVLAAWWRRRDREVVKWQR